MIEQVAAAFEGQAYSEVAHSLKALAAEDPWNQLYQVGVRLIAADGFVYASTVK